MAQRSIVRYSVWFSATAVLAAALAGCGSLNSILEPDRIDYKSAGKAPKLEIPPDLTQLQREGRYSLPENNRGVATASGYEVTRQTQTPQNSASSSVIGPKVTSDARIERAGNQRWLVVKQTPEALWPQIKDFWQDSGFLINTEAQEAGIMETDWAENRAKIPQDFIRSALGKVLDSVYSTGERDKFRTRLERGADGTTEIFISHRGAQEVLTGDRDSSVWTPRPADPELEAEFLSRLMARLGTEEVKAKAAVQSAALQPARARLVRNAGASYVEVDESFERAWRRVGLALDRVGFTVEDRDRSKGIFFVRYLDQAADAQSTPTKQKGFFAKLFSFGDDDKPKNAQRYQILVKGESANSQVTVLDSEGRQDRSAAADRILALLNEQLK